MGVKRPPLAWCQVDLPNLDPVVLEPQPRAYLEIARGDGKLVLELRRIEGSLLGDLSHGQTLIQARGARRTVVDRDHLAVLPPDGPHSVAHLAPAGIQDEVPQQCRGPPPPHSLGHQALTVSGVAEVARGRGLGRHIRGLTASPTLV